MSLEQQIRLPLRDNFAGIEPYGAPQLDVDVAINVNENPYPVPEPVIAAITAAVREAASSLNRYPDRDFLALRRALSEYLAQESGVSFEPDWLWAGNGSNEVMAHLFTAFGGQGHPVLSASPTYSMYPEYARDTDTELIDVPRREDFSLDMTAFREAILEAHPAMVVLASPNNPTGTQLPLDQVAELLELTRDTGPKRSATVVVIDEAYIEFRRDGVPSALELLAHHPHLVVTRTMSKAFAMAGLRLGYLVAHPQIVKKLQVVRLPYHLSTLTQAAAIAALHSADLLQSQVAQIRATRDYMVTRLRDMGLTVADSDTNFVFFGRFPDRQKVWQDLLDRSVLIRAVGPEGWLRASVGTESETQRFFAALEEVVK